MKAEDVMTRDVATVTPESSIQDIVHLLMSRRVSAVPVVDADGKPVGIVSEGDLIRRPEIAGERLLTWWASMIASPDQLARDYVRSHGQTARSVMTPGVVAVEPSTPIEEIVRLMERHKIKRTPVVRDGKVVGIVSRGDLLRLLAEAVPPPAGAATSDDAALQTAVLAKFKAQGWDTAWLNVSVEQGIVKLSGLIDGKDLREALEVAAHEVPGVRAVESRFTHRVGFA